MQKSPRIWVYCKLTPILSILYYNLQGLRIIQNDLFILISLTIIDRILSFAMHILFLKHCWFVVMDV